MQRLNRAALGLPAPAASRRIVHIGIGAFARAHLVWYTARASDAADWAISAFTGRSPELAELLAPQDGLYTLIERGPSGSSYEVLAAIDEVIAADRVDLLVARVADPATALISLTITEAGYLLLPDGSPDPEAAALRDDLALLRVALNGAPTPPRTPLCRLLLALDARRRTGGGAIALVPCDNVPGNGGFLRRGLLELAAAGSSDLAAWLTTSASFVSTSVDRITPRLTGTETVEVAAATGWEDAAPVVTEPYADWVLEGDFPAGRPDWESAGARFVDDVHPYESRKLWLLNGAHTLLACSGLLRGHSSVAEAVGDPDCLALVEAFWDECARQLPAELHADEYRRALLARFRNPGIQHALEQVGQDTLTKLRARLAPIARAELAAGRDARATAAGVAAWIALVRRGDAPRDAEAERIRAAAGPRDLIALIDPALAADPPFAGAVEEALNTDERLVHGS
jgi:fructuronate reductase